jgi:pimeloyl-ACP methyl ester carboxylesterase
MRDPVFRGRSTSLGRGHPVLLIPGFMAGDWSLAAVHDWLRRLGYRPVMAGISFNFLASERTLDGLSSRLRSLHRRSGRPVSLLGHSRGGLLAKVLADRNPDHVDQVIALGSPLSDPYDLHFVTRSWVEVARLFNRVRFGLTPAAEDSFLRDLSAPARVPVTSIYTRSDGVVRWRSCVRDDVTCVEVRGSHGGLANNPEVYRVLVRLLQPTAAAPEPVANSINQAASAQ